MHFHRYLAYFFYLSAIVVLTFFSLVMIGTALWQAWSAFRTPDFVSTMLSAVGLLVIAIAVFDVSKFLIEEEVLREAERRTPGQARRTLTKFMTIIIVAVSLEALVLIFDTGKTDITTLIYPASLLLTVIALVVGLGLYHKLSASAEQDTADKQ